MWVIEKIEISGGFLPGLSVNIPPGLTCIIGARGSGKSTLAEAVRFALCGLSAAPKHCADLIQANLAGGALVTITALADGSNRYAIKRGLKQNPLLLTFDGRAINTVDLDRGTFLPLDAYSSLEIESIADEALGHKRRNLLDELRSEQMRSIHLSLAESARALETNADRMRRYDSLLAATMAPVEKHLSAIHTRIREAQSTLAQARQSVAEIHTSHAGELAKLTALNQAASEQARVRTSLEQQVARLEALEQQRIELHTELKMLFERRKSLKTDHILMRDQVSTMRDEVASELQHEAGERVRIRVMRNADHMSYTQTLVDGLKGARVRNQNEILATLLQLRPEQLAQLIQSNDLHSFEEATHFGTERSRKILDAFRESVDPLALEITPIEDRIAIELNVATAGHPHFKDASDLSRGQKCTALLPILLARRDNPLIIDQPEDNLDNHFIFETVVNAVQRMKKRRQMIFITHNANIPVLAEAELVLVMTSDGRVGAIERRGTVDECREQIIDLLEGGREAFALRSKRYAAG